MHPWKEAFGIELNVVSTREKWISLAGGVLSMILLMWLSHWMLGSNSATSIVASMGASAVLLFAVPHGQLSQPWPVIAGHGISALIGVACYRWIPQLELAAALAVGLSIGAMHQFKCIHPPGGATAFTAVMGGSAIHDLGFRFVLFPVLANALVIVLLAVAINALFAWRRYPAFLNRALHTHAASDSTHGEIVQALRSLDSFVDITEDDLVRLHQLLTHPSSLAGRKQPNQTSKHPTRDTVHH